MSIYATNTGTNYTPVPAGSHVARCYSMIQIGTITESFQGKEKTLNKVRVTWELPNEKKVFKEENGEQPYSISKDFTLSMHEKSNLRKFLEGWRGKAFNEEQAKSFDVTKLLGVPCMLSIIHKTSKDGNLYAEINSVSGLPKGLICPDQINPSFELSFENFDEIKFELLPDWLKDKIKTSMEYRKLMNPEHTEAHDESAIYRDTLDNDLSDLPF